MTGKKNIIILIVFLTFIAFLGTQASAADLKKIGLESQEVVEKQTERPKSSMFQKTSTEINPKGGLLSSRNILLQEQNRLLVKHNSELLNTIYWALTFAALFLISFLAVIAYLALRRDESVKEALSRGIDNEIFKAKAELDQQFNSWKAAFNENAEIKMNSFQDSLKEIAESATESKFVPLEDRVMEISENVVFLEIKNLAEGAQRWESKDATQNALMNWFEVAKKALSIKQSWILTDALKNIVRILKDGGDFEDEHVDEVKSFLKSLPMEFEVLANDALLRI